MASRRPAARRGESCLGGAAGARGRNAATCAGLCWLSLTQRAAHVRACCPGSQKPSPTHPLAPSGPSRRPAHPSCHPRLMPRPPASLQQRRPGWPCQESACGGCCGRRLGPCAAASGQEAGGQEAGLCSRRQGQEEVTAAFLKLQASPLCTVWCCTQPVAPAQLLSVSSLLWCFLHAPLFAACPVLISSAAAYLLASWHSSILPLPAAAQWVCWPHVYGSACNALLALCNASYVRASAGAACCLCLGPLACEMN